MSLNVPTPFWPGSVHLQWLIGEITWKLNKNSYLWGLGSSFQLHMYNKFLNNFNIGNSYITTNLTFAYSKTSRLEFFTLKDRVWPPMRLSISSQVAKIHYLKLYVFDSVFCRVDIDPATAPSTRVYFSRSWYFIFFWLQDIRLSSPTK